MRIAGSLAALAAALVLVPSAWATFPGGNGKILFVDLTGSNYQRSDLFTVNPDGSGRTNLTAAFKPDVEEGAWSPDGTQIAFLTAAYTNPPQWQLWVMNADGSGKTRLKRFAGPMRFDFGPTPAWSPDGRSITLPLLDRDSEDLFAVRVDGTGQRRLTSFRRGAVTHPAWSPDGTRIAFTRFFPRSGFVPYVANADGTAIRRLTPFEAFHPDWAPDGSRLIVTSFEGAYVVDSNGETATRLRGFEGDGYGDGPTWSPDGTKILRSSDLAEYVNPDGTCPTTIPRSGSLGPRWQPVPGAPPSGEIRCADLAASMLSDSQWGAVGRPSSFRLTVRNDGNEPAENVELVESLRDEFRFAGTHPSVPCSGSRPVRCQLGTLDPGARLALEVVLVPLQSFEVGHRFEVVTTTPDPDRYDASGWASIDACSHLGSAGSDVIRGTPDADLICAGGGRDVIHARGGNDYVYAHGGNDVVFSGEGNDHVYGDRGSDRLHGGDGSDTIEGGDGRDRLFGGPGRDYLNGKGDPDLLDGGPGYDYARAGLRDVVRAIESVYRLGSRS